MHLTGKRGILILIFAGSLFLAAAVLGTALGLSLAVNRNTSNMDELIASRPALPSKVLDINGELITEFFSDEKRDIISITSLPEKQILALLTREDAPFFQHTGVSVKGFFRALANNILYLATRRQGYISGFSTLSMQVAGTRHADRSDISVKRKLKEIWWTYQLERRFTKEEILEQYFNSVYFGHTTYGVEAASQFFFGHSATENTVAEAVMLVIQLAGSGIYSPIIQPQTARNRQREILNQMVAAGHITRDEADTSFEDYWNSFDWSRSDTASPYFDRLANDKAPYFSEYIRSQVEQYLFGQQDIYRDGYTIHTTLNLDYQREADEQIAAGLAEWNSRYRKDRDRKTRYAVNQVVDTVDLLSLAFGISQIHMPGTLEKRQATEYVQNELTPIMGMMAMAFGMTDLKSLSNVSYNNQKANAQMNTVETALITLDNENGYILAMVGGTEFNRNNQFNRAMSANVMPGSAFKPLYYSAAISSGTYTPSTRIHDGPRVFLSPDGTPYTPGNYNGRWNGYVLVRDALARSLNIPAVTVLENIGFDAAISRSADLLGITDPQEIARTFERVYPLGLGILSVAPVQLARAFATIANQGRAVEPLAIRYIEDRDGNVIVNPERDLREEQARKDIQVLSPQAAYVMTSMLQSTITGGTMAYAHRNVGGFDGMPMAGKTGTTQNWTDAWTMGFSPYYTTALWVGFDKRGNSLGPRMTGAATGRTWSAYMKNIHEDLPRIAFPRPQSGIVQVNIDRRTGMLPAPGTPEKNIRSEIFIAGTEPKSYGELATFEYNRNQDLIGKIASDSSNLGSLEDLNVSGYAYTQSLLAEMGLSSQYLDNATAGEVDVFDTGDNTPPDTFKLD